MREIHRTLEPGPSGEMTVDAAKAAVQGIRFRDFTHWRREEDEAYTPVYTLEIGCGWSLQAEPDPLMNPATAVTVLYDGPDYALELRTDRYDLESRFVELIGDDGTATLHLPVLFDIKGYVLRQSEKQRRGRITFVRGRHEWKTDILDRRGEYRGCPSPPSPIPIADGFKDRLNRATSLQRFDGLRERFCETEEDRAGPIEFRFEGLAGAVHCTDITGTVRGGVSGLISFEMKGTLTSDDEGFLLDAEDSVFVLKAGTGCPAEVDLDYIRSHPAPSWSVDDR